MNNFFVDVDSQWIAAGLALLMGMTLELGYRLGRHHQRHIGDPARSQVSAIQGATLGLLALLLGFTFSLALQRHDDRSRALAAEANALGTAWLRSGLLAEPLREQAQATLAAYIRQRIATTGVAQSAHEQLARLAAREASQQHDLWRSALAAAGTDSGVDPRFAAMYIESINAAIDAYGLHEAALARHVPPVVLLLLLLSFGFSGAVVGYAAGVHGHRGLVSNTLMLGLISMLVFLIVDIDRPRRGLITVDSGPMQALEAQLPPAR
jgi:hypothetical protein